MPANWKDDFDSSLALQKLEALKVTNSDGVQGFKAFECERHLSLIEHNLEIDESIPLPDSRDLVHSGVIDAAKSGVLSSERVLRAVRKRELDFLRRKDIPYIVVTSVSISRKDLPIEKRIGDSRIKVVFSLAKKFDLEGIYARVATFGVETPPGEYGKVRISVEGKSMSQALERGLNALELLLGIWNFSLNSRSVSFKFGNSGRKPISKIVLGPLHTLHFPDGAAATQGFWFNSQFSSTYPSTFEWSSRPKKFEKNEQITRSAIGRSNYPEKLERFIREYHRACSSYDGMECFLALWRLLEKLTNTSQDRYETTIKRASNLFDERLYARQLLRVLRDYRNKAVHIGHDDIANESLIRELQGIVEAALQFHIFNKFRFSSPAEAAEFMDISPESLVRQIEMRRFALKYHRMTDRDGVQEK